MAECLTTILYGPRAIRVKIMARKEEPLKLGKGAAFVKSRLKRLPQSDETWEADFQALPKPIIQNETHYLGMIVAKKGGTLLADRRFTADPRSTTSPRSSPTP